MEVVHRQLAERAVRARAQPINHIAEDHVQSRQRLVLGHTGQDLGILDLELALPQLTAMIQGSLLLGLGIDHDRLVERDVGRNDLHILGQVQLRIVDQALKQVFRVAHVVPSGHEVGQSRLVLSEDLVHLRLEHVQAQPRLVEIDKPLRVHQQGRRYTHRPSRLYQPPVCFLHLLERIAHLLFEPRQANPPVVLADLDLRPVEVQPKSLQQRMTQLHDELVEVLGVERLKDQVRLGSLQGVAGLDPGARREQLANTRLESPGVEVSGLQF